MTDNATSVVSNSFSPLGEMTGIVEGVMEVNHEAVSPTRVDILMPQNELDVLGDPNVLSSGHVL